MRMMWLRVVAVTGVIAVACLAHAERHATPSVTIRSFLDRRVQITTSDVDVRESGELAVVTIAITVTTSAQLRHVATTTIAIPRGAKVLDLSYEHDGFIETAEAVPANEARRLFNTNRQENIDPALLSWSARTRDHDRLALSVFPVAPDREFTAKLTLIVPRFERLAVDIAGKRSVHAPPPAADLPWFETETLEGTPPTRLPEGVTVDATTSLYAGPRAISDDVWQPALPAVSRREVRKYVRLMYPRLHACYQHGVQRDHSLAGLVTLRFTISPDGSILSPYVTGDLPDRDVRDCLVQVVSTWAFREGGEPVRINYPLRFTLH